MDKRHIGILCALFVEMGVAIAAESNGAVEFTSIDYRTISAAVEACAKAGGGRVIVPSGVHETGPVHMRSNVELHFENGAKLVFTDDRKAYLPAVPVSWNGAEAKNYSPLIYAFGCTNVSVTGRGTLAPRLAFWSSWRNPELPGLNKVKKLQREWAEKGVAVDGRDMTAVENSGTRPHLMHFNRCKNVRLDGFSVRGSPFWTIHVFRSADVHVSNLDVSAWGEDGAVLNNSDGVDIEMSRRVSIVNCTFEQADDAVVIKAGRFRDKTFPLESCEDVEVRGCTVRKGHVLLGIGSEVTGGIRNILLKDCRVDGDVSRVFYVKTSPVRGGFVSDVTMDGVSAKKVTGDIVAVNTRTYYGMPGEECQGPMFTLTSISNLTVRNVSCEWAKRAVTINGDPDYPIRNVTISDVRADEVFENFIKIENVDGIAVDVAAKKVHPDAHW